jgi:N-dimethylarginine dimethylaminohydrolase
MSCPASVLMCAPSHFDVRYAINPWMRNHNVPVDRIRAMAQWSALRNAISERTSVTLAEPDRLQPDMCFAANAGLVQGSTFVSSAFRHAERRGEEALFRRWFESRGFDLRTLPPGVLFEGAGDALFDRKGRLWMGHGQRSELAAQRPLEKILECEVLPLKLVDPRFYHLDTCYCPLSNGYVMYYPAAFDPASLHLIEAKFPLDRRIAVDETDATQFACNAVDLGDLLLVNRVGARLRPTIERSGLSIREIELTEFIKSGGGAKCLVLPLGSYLPDVNRHELKRNMADTLGPSERSQPAGELVIFSHRQSKSRHLKQYARGAPMRVEAAAQVDHPCGKRDESWTP